MKYILPPLLFASSIGLASTASAENLLQVYQHAKTYDPQLKAVEENYRAIQESIAQAKAAKKSQINLSAGSSLSHSNTYNTIASNGSSDIFSTNYSVNLVKPLYNKSLTAVIGKADAATAQARADLDNQKQNLIIRTAESYFNILLAQENVNFAIAEKKAIAKQLEQVKAHFEAGILAITDVKETQSRYDQASAQVIAANNQLALAKEALQVITGRLYKHYAGSANGIRLTPPKPNKIEAWISIAEKNNKQLQAFRYAINVAEKNLEQQRAARKPTVDLVASHSGNFARGVAGSDSVFDRDQIDNAIGVQLKIPLYTSGAISSKIRDALHNKRKAQHNLEAQKQQIHQQVRSAYLSILSDISRANSLKQALDSAETALEATQAGFEVGTRTAVDVLISLRNVFAAKRDYANARYNYLLNMLKLKQAAGTISINDIKQATALLGS